MRLCSLYFATLPSLILNRIERRITSYRNTTHAHCLEAVWHKIHCRWAEAAKPNLPHPLQ